MDKGFQSIPEFVKLVHFNKNKPQNHNILMPNWRDKNKILAFDGENWNLSEKDAILEDLKCKGIDFI